MEYGKDSLSQDSTSGAGLITQEREEQISKHGRTIEKDVEQNAQRLLTQGAIALLSTSNFPLQWDGDLCFKMIKKPYKQRLIIAGALIAAEIDRLNYLENQEKKGENE